MGVVFDAKTYMRTSFAHLRAMGPRPCGRLLPASSYGEVSSDAAVTARRRLGQCRYWSTSQLRPLVAPANAPGANDTPARLRGLLQSWPYRYLPAVADHDLVASACRSPVSPNRDAAISAHVSDPGVKGSYSWRVTAPPAAVDSIPTRPSLPYPPLNLVEPIAFLDRARRYGFRR